MVPVTFLSWSFHSCHNMHIHYLYISFSSPEVQLRVQRDNLMQLLHIYKCIIKYSSNHKRNAQENDNSSENDNSYNTSAKPLRSYLRLLWYSEADPHFRGKWYISLVSPGLPMSFCESVFDLMPERAQKPAISSLNFSPRPTLSSCLKCHFILPTIEKWDV